MIEFFTGLMIGAFSVLVIQALIWYRKQPSYEGIPTNNPGSSSGGRSITLVTLDAKRQEQIIEETMERIKSDLNCDSQLTRLVQRISTEGQ